MAASFLLLHGIENHRPPQHWQFLLAADLVGAGHDVRYPALYGDPLDVAATVVPGAGHITPDSGYGHWPDALRWCLFRDPGAVR